MFQVSEVIEAVGLADSWFSTALIPEQLARRFFPSLSIKTSWSRKIRL
jgi:hypothetical protein